MFKKVIIILITVIISIPLAFGIRCFVIHRRINDNFCKVYSDNNLQRKIILEDFHGIRQSVTCGYATIQVTTGYLGDEITEEELMDKNNNKITTASPGGFYNELSSQIGHSYKVTMLSNLPDSKLLAKIHERLEANFCVPFVFAAVDDWNKPNYTLHFSVVTGMDITEDKIYVSNVYGYEEVYSVEEFLDALKFKNFENMPIFIRLGVFFGFFNKNTIFSIEKMDN